MKIDETLTIPRLFLDSAGKYPDKPALLRKVDGAYKPLSYGELKSQVAKAAGHLKSLGLGWKDKLAIMCENGPEWVIADLASQCLGGIVVPLHTTSGQSDVGYIMNHSEAKIAVVSRPSYLELVLSAQSPFLQCVICLFDCPTDMSSSVKIITWPEFISAEGNFDLSAIVPQAEDICSIIYTSGTTGRPKGVELTHRNITSNVQMTEQDMPTFVDDVFLSFLPLSHILERKAGYYSPLYTGGTIAYAESIAELAKNLQEVRPTVLIGVPRIYEKFRQGFLARVAAGPVWKKKLVDWALSRDHNGLARLVADRLVYVKVRGMLGGRLRFATTSGAPIDPEVIRFYLRSGINLIEGYGLTETSPVVTFSTFDKYKPGSVGRAMEGVYIKTAPDGEVLIKGPNVMNGYHKDNQATAEAIDTEGWLHSGDIGVIDSDGFLFLTGRKKELIITSYGKNIWPERIENILNSRGLVAQSIVNGDRQPYIVALIVPDRTQLAKTSVCAADGSILEAGNLDSRPEIRSIFQQVIDEVNSELSNEEKIKKFAILDRDFSHAKGEITSSLKLARHVILDNFSEQIRQFYS